jgi:hypothetical protein
MLDRVFSSVVLALRFHVDMRKMHKNYWQPICKYISQLRASFSNQNIDLALENIFAVCLQSVALSVMYQLLLSMDDPTSKIPQKPWNWTYFGGVFFISCGPRGLAPSQASDLICM